MRLSNPPLVYFQITVANEYLELEPIGMLFILFFGIVLVIQFVAMLFHRFGTLTHMLATTQINWFRGGPQVGQHPTTLYNVSGTLFPDRG
jgi:hypothetical protein